ncbi:3488_t:CDS:2 [Diversispora eburnea]|uniref:3488_t:CDS:1 n=1 Tax=Diversispora eburnea TaxID=1213867 RepID=A0A9N9CED6_9GLOM|nr:3488_t:CDS:2 [Diversispora eburnea]
MLKITFLLFTIIALCLAADPLTLVKKDYVTHTGYYYGIPVELHVFNIITGLTKPPSHIRSNRIYVFIPPSGGYKVQKNLIDFIPGDNGYSDLWHVNVVTGRKSGDPPVKSVSDLLKLERDNCVKIKPIKLFVNIPIVGSGSTLKNPLDAAAKTVYYRGQIVNCFDFGPTENLDVTAPLVHVLDNKENVVLALPSTIPGEKDFSAWWNIFNVSPPYFHNITTILGEIKQYERFFSGININCPIVSVGGKPVRGDPKWEEKLCKRG